jgi:hypothetical protein
MGSVSLSPDGKYAAVTKTCELRVFETDTGKKVLLLGQERFKGKMPKPSEVKAVWAPDSKKLLLLGDDKCGSIEVVSIHE